jgi:hypothetical protein
MWYRYVADAAADRAEPLAKFLAGITFVPSFSETALPNQSKILSF